MSKTSIPIIAAVPNFNMAPALDTLLAQLVTADYDAVYVLDDASTDMSVEVVKKYPTVRLIQNSVNKGSGATRNRILEELKTEAIIHFLDADVQLETSHPAKAIDALDLSADSGFVGGVVLTDEGKQDPWNYGPRLRLLSDITVPFYLLASSVSIFSGLRQSFHERPETTTQLPESVYWVLESNLIMHSETMRQLGGFDGASREHDIQPMAAKAYQQHRRNFVTDTVVVTRRRDIKVRGYSRPLKFVRSHFRVINRHIGWKRYFF